MSETTYTLRLQALPQEIRQREQKLTQALQAALAQHRAGAASAARQRLNALRAMEHPVLLGLRRVRLALGQVKTIKLAEPLQAAELRRLRAQGVEVDTRVRVRIELPEEVPGPPSVVQALPSGQAQAFRRGQAVETELPASAVPAWREAGFRVTAVEEDKGSRKKEKAA